MFLREDCEIVGGGCGCGASLVVLVKRAWAGVAEDDCCPGRVPVLGDVVGAERVPENVAGVLDSGEAEGFALKGEVLPFGQRPRFVRRGG